MLFRSGMRCSLLQYRHRLSQPERDLSSGPLPCGTGPWHWPVALARDMRWLAATASYKPVRCGCYIATQTFILRSNRNSRSGMPTKTITQRLSSGDRLLMDGGTGSELQWRGVCAEVHDSKIDHVLYRCIKLPTETVWAKKSALTILTQASLHFDFAVCGGLRLLNHAARKVLANDLDRPIARGAEMRAKKHC